MYRKKYLKNILIFGGNILNIRSYSPIFFNISKYNLHITDQQF